MILWRVEIDFGDKDIVMEKYYYIVSCDSETRAKELALKIHNERYPDSKTIYGNVEIVSSARKLELCTIKYGVWADGYDVFRGGYLE